MVFVLACLRDATTRHEQTGGVCAQPPANCFDPRRDQSLRGVSSRCVSFPRHRVHLGGSRAFALRQVGAVSTSSGSAEAREPPTQGRWRENHKLSRSRIDFRLTVSGLWNLKLLNPLVAGIGDVAMAVAVEGPAVRVGELAGVTG